MRGEATLKLLTDHPHIKMDSQTSLVSEEDDNKSHCFIFGVSVGVQVELSVCILWQTKNWRQVSI